MKYLSVLLFVFIISCKSSPKNLTAQEIIDKSILVSGSDKITNSDLKFKFRGKEYIAKRKSNGSFKLIKKYKDERLGFVSDVLSNKGFKKLINGTPYQLKDSIANVHSNAVNSVHYFSVLPYGLNDKAVNKKLLPSSTIKGEEYYKIEVTFSENGGGEDFEDVFIYWIGKEDFLLDYLAYSYHTNGGGKRFRAINKEFVENGIRFVNYDNYKPIDESINLIDTDKAFEENQLKKLSEINLEDVKVTFLD